MMMKKKKKKNGDGQSAALRPIDTGTGGEKNKTKDERFLTEFFFCFCFLPSFHFFSSHIKQKKIKERFVRRRLRNAMIFFILLFIWLFFGVWGVKYFWNWSVSTFFAANKTSRSHWYANEVGPLFFFFFFFFFFIIIILVFVPPFHLFSLVGSFLLFFFPFFYFFFTLRLLRNAFFFLFSRLTPYCLRTSGSC